MSKVTLPVAQKKRRSPIGDLPAGVAVASVSNGHGGEYWRVRLGKKFTGSKPVVKYFKTVTEAREWIKGSDPEASAKAEKVGTPSAITIKAVAGATGFELTPKQLGEAIAAQKLLESTKTTAGIYEAVEFFIRHTRPESGERSIPEVIDELLAAKRRANRKENYLKNLEWPLRRFADDFKDSKIHEVTRDDFEAWLDDEDFGNTTRRNYIRDCGILFNFAIAKKWMNHSPTKGIEKPIVDDREIEMILSVRQIARLLLTAQNTPEFRPYLAPIAIQIFAGVRTSEIKHLLWNEVKDDEIVILGSTAKTRQRRTITITPALQSWIAEDREDIGPVFSSGKCWRRGFTKLIEAARIQPWPRNALRHSFGSYHYALHRNENLTAAEMGNTPQVIFKHYRAIVSQKDKDRFWNLITKKPHEQVIPFKIA